MVPHACQGPTLPPAPAVSPCLGKAWMPSCVLVQENVKQLWWFSKISSHPVRGFRWHKTKRGVICCEEVATLSIWSFLESSPLGDQLIFPDHTLCLNLSPWLLDHCFQHERTFLPLVIYPL